MYSCVDEMQAVAEWEPFVDRLLRTGRCRIYLTGSSAELLSRVIAAQMRVQGRYHWELFPFSFREFHGLSAHWHAKARFPPGGDC